jgi:predicted flap endonuclease-1-like 5' DNA nuclease
VVDPPAGLDAVSRALVGDLILYASRGFALILDRAITQSGAAPPEVELAAETLIAALKIPLKLVQKKLVDAADRALVQRMYDELVATGRVEANLPEDDRTVRELHRREVLEPRAAQQTAERAKRLPQTEAERRAKPLRPTAPPPAAPAGTTSAMRLAISVPEVREQRPWVQGPLPAPLASLSSSSSPSAPKPLMPATPAAADSRQLAALRRPRKPHLDMTDDVEAAPSIGPKMAERLALGGISTVAELLAAEPAAAALKLGDRHITEETIRDWQDQARLVCAVPGLRGTQAQLLVGSGYRTAEDIRTAEAGALCAAVLGFAATPAGQRLLRDGPAPDIGEIKSWIEWAVAARAA